MKGLHKLRGSVVPDEDPRDKDKKPPPPEGD